jgi:hypothetical protein
MTRAHTPTGPTPAALPFPFPDIRSAVLAIENAERENLEAEVHLLRDPRSREELDCQRRHRLADLQDLLVGPLLQAAKQPGWGDEVVTARGVALFHAAMALSRWDDRAAALGMIEFHNSSDRPSYHPILFSVNLDGGPADRLLALGANLKKALEGVMKLAGATADVGAAVVQDAVPRGKPGRRGYPVEALNYARELRRNNPTMKAHVIRQRCLKKFSEDDLPPDPESFRRWLNRKRANRA